jgi:hypothetical protein
VYFDISKTFESHIIVRFVENCSAKKITVDRSEIREAVKINQLILFWNYSQWGAWNQRENQTVPKFSKSVTKMVQISTRIRKFRSEGGNHSQIIQTD